jgi:hypothetical protein
MPKTRYSLQNHAPRVGWRVLVASCVILPALGCDERERLTFPEPNDGIGPVTTIDRPNSADTTVVAGPDFFLSGQSVDPDGVDSVYFFVIAGTQGFDPVHPVSPRNTVIFGLRLTTFGHAGETFLVEVYGVDALGNRGETSTRQIIIR